MEESHQALEKIAHGTILAFGGIFISKVFGYVYRLIVARFGIEEYGVLSLGLTLFNVLIVLGALGLNQGALRYVSFYREKKDFGRVKGIIFSTIGISGLISIFLGALLFFFADKIAVSAFHEPRLGIILKILAFVLPIDVIKNVMFNVMRGFQNIKYEIYSKNIVETGLKVVLTLVLLFLGYKVIGATIAFAIAGVVSFLMAAHYLMKTTKDIRKEKRTPFIDKKLLFYSIPLLLNSLTSLVLLGADTLIIGHFRPIGEVGIYNAAGPSATLLYLFPQAFLSLFLPVLMGLYAKGKTEEFRRVFSTVIKWVLVINTAMLGFFILCAKQFLGVFFGAEYAVGGSVLSVLAVGYFVYYIAFITTHVLMIYEKTRLIFLLSMVSAIINLVLNVILVIRFGIIGAAVGTTFAYLVMSVFILRNSFKLTKVRVFLNKMTGKIMAIGIVAGCVAFGVTYGMNLSVPGLLLIRSGIFGGVYVGLAFLFGVVKQDDLLILSELKKISLRNLGAIEKLLKKLAR
ncbi:MAG: flippase [Candidatus Nanoarchaeia archaeon]